MKTAISKIRNKIAFLFAAMLTSAFCMASIPNLTPDVNDTWKVDVTTAKADLVVYTQLAPQTSSPGVYTIEFINNQSGFLADLKYSLKEGAYNALQVFAYKTGAVAFADAPDLSAITAGFFKKGPEVFRKNVNSLDLTADGIAVYKNVSGPITLPKLSAKGGPRPYRTNDDSSGNGFSIGDRLLTLRASKWDMIFSPKEFFNTAYDDASDKPFYEQGLDQIATEYMAAINDNVLGSGNYNGSGTTAAAIADGWLTIIADEITATTITPVVTGTITSANAVTKVELIKTAMPAWMRSKGANIYCSYSVFDLYVAHYRATYGFSFVPQPNGKYAIDGTSNIFLVPQSWMGSSQRLIATVARNLVFGTNGDNIGVHPSMKFDQIETRLTMDVACQIADLEAIVVNDQA